MDRLTGRTPNGYAYLVNVNPNMGAAKAVKLTIGTFTSKRWEAEQ